ncbi:MAG: CpsD/CapB family tyrosine-protein kinase, partial [Gemmataceae bacterium]
LPLSGPHSALFRALPVAKAEPVPVLRRPKFAPEIVTYHTPDQPASTRYAELLASIREAAAVKAVVDHLVLLFAPVRPEVGSTTVLLNVAVVAARQGRRTLVVDANLKRPAVAARLGLTPSPGLMEVLAADCSIDEATRPTDQDGLFALTAGQSGPLLADVRTLHDLLATLRERFDFVLIDGPRWDGRGTTTAIASGCDAVFLVTPVSEADTPPASDLARQLPQQGVRLAGAILTGH